MLCEKCWSDAYLRSLGTGKSQYTVYLEILEERKDNPCPLEEAQLTKYALDAANSAPAQADSSLDIIPASVAGSQPRK